jgi:hypothetical protein
LAKDLAIVLNNGSVNSAVATALAAQKHRPVMLFIDAGADASGRMRAAYDQQVGHFKPYREYSIPMNAAAGPLGQSPPNSADPRQTPPLAPQMLKLLPLIAVAARSAANHQAAAIYMGMRVGPATDTLAQATEYFQIWNELLQIPCGQTELELNIPLLELEPWQVIELGFQVNAPLDRTWSCQEEGGEPCLACKSCRAREAAFQQAGKPDPMRVVRKV